MATALDILKIAQGEIGVKEAPAGSNKVKYNTSYYGKAVSGSAYPWCVVFVWWCFQQSGASDLFYGGNKTASCTVLNTYHKGKGQAVTGDYQPGDIVFFNFSGGKVTEHVGICESFDGAYITTIDGNTGSTNESNGGAVMRRKRLKKYVVAAIRPKYEIEDDTMTGKEIYEALQEYLSGQPVPDWAKDELEKAKVAGITDATNPMQLIPRYQAALMAYRASKK